MLTEFQVLISIKYNEIDPIDQKHSHQIAKEEKYMKV